MHDAAQEAPGCLSSLVHVVFPAPPLSSDALRTPPAYFSRGEPVSSDDIVGRLFFCLQMARLASGSVNEKDVRAAVAALHAIINNAGAGPWRALLSTLRPRRPIGSHRHLPRPAHPGSPTCPASRLLHVRFLCDPAARYEVDEMTLARELEQLGLPKGAQPRCPARARNLPLASKPARRDTLPSAPGTP